MSKLFRLVVLVAVAAHTFLGVATPARAASLPAEINKQFTPISIDAGAVSVLRVTIFNPNTFPLTNAGYTDNLIGVQPGLFIANPAINANTCGGTVTAVPGATTFSLSGGTVPAQVGATPGECYVEINVSSVTSGNLINTIPTGGLTAQGNDGGTTVSISNTTPASATITVIAVSPPSLTKSFSPNTIFVGQTSTLTIRINNNDADTNLTEATYTDTLPAGVVLASPVGATATGCGPYTLTAIPGGNTITLSNATVTPSVDCVVTVNVTGVSGQYTNTIPAGPSAPGSLQTRQGVTNNSPASAPLNIQPVGITKSFTPTTIDAGDNTSNLTITFQNPTGTPYTGVSVTDNLPANLSVAGAPSVNTCGFTVTAPVDATSIVLTNGTIPASASPPTLNTCQLVIPIKAALTSPQVTRTNTIPANAMTADQPGVTNYVAASANLTINSALTGTKTYSPTSIVVGGTSTVTITLTNRSGVALTNVTFTDTLPANLNVSGTPASPQCGGGTVTFTATSVTLTGGSIPANSSCTIVFNVTSTIPGSGTTYENSIPANSISTDQGVSNLANIVTGTDLTVVSGTSLPVTVTKAFQTNPINLGQTSRLRITITAPGDTAITGLNVTDNLPAGLVIAATPAPVNGCGGTLTATPGTDIITLTGGSRTAGQSCTIDVWITSNTPGLYTNTIPANSVTTTQGRTNNADAIATIRVTSMSVSKSFYPNVVQAGGSSTLTIVLQNTSDSPIINVSLLDTLPGTATNGIRIAPVPNASTTCGGTLTANPGQQNIQLTGGVIPAQVGGIPGVCTINVDVRGLDSTPATPSTQTNTIPIANVNGTVQSTGTAIQPTAAASAILTIQPLTIGIVKGFNPVLVYGGAYSTMSIQINNPNLSATLTGITFTDDMTLLGTGMQLANPVAFNTGTCGGTLTGNPGDTSFTFSGGVLPPSSSCTLTLRVVMNVNGNLTNRIPAGAVTTFNGVTNPDPTQASLTNLPGVSVTKVFSPPTVLTNQPSTLTITIRNTSNVPVVGMGVADNLPGTLPDGLEVADPANASNTCGGTLTANPGAQTIQLSGGGLAALGSPGDVCTIQVDVISTRPGTYLNTIPAGALTASGGITNPDPANDILTVEPAIFSLGNRLWYDTNNNGIRDITEFGINNVRVELYQDTNANGFYDAGDTFAGFTTTDASGYYRFDNLSAGNYVVVIPNSQFTLGGPLYGYWSSGTSVNASGSLSDSFANNPETNPADNDDNGETAFSAGKINYVAALAVTLGPTANEPTNDNDPTPNPGTAEAPNPQSNRTVDFGFYRAQLGNLIFFDANNNGVFDAGDSPLAGATVQLLAADGTTEINVGPDGILGTADDAPGGVTTGAGGTYLFSGLPEGNYIVKVTPPAGYESTTDTGDVTDSTNPNTNTDNNDNGVGTSGGAVSSNIIALTPGSFGAQSNNTVTPATGTTYNPTLDFGFVFAPTPTPTNTATPTPTDTPTPTATPTPTDTPTPTATPVSGIEISKTISAVEILNPVSIKITYTLTVTNTGATELSKVQVTDDLSTAFAASLGYTLVDVTTSSGLTENPDYDGNTDINLLAGSDTLTAGQTETITLVVNVTTGGTAQTYTNVATASGEPTFGPPVTDTAIASGPEFADPAVTKAADVTLASVGDLITFTITVTNNGNQTATGVRVTDPLPSNMDYVSATSVPRGAISLVLPRTVVVDIGDVAPGDVITIRVVARVNSEGNPPIENRVTLATTSSTDLVSNDTSIVSLTVIRPLLPATGFAPNKMTRLPLQPQNKAYTAYNDLGLQIPALKVSMPIVGIPKAADGWDVTWLGQQAGWLNGTAFPTWSGNSVVTGHVYLSNGLPGPFVNLGKLKYGDQVIVNAFGQRYIYEVRSVLYLKPDDTTRALRHEDKAWITLLTCKDYDPVSNTYLSRVAVRAVLIKVEAGK